METYSTIHLVILILHHKYLFSDIYIWSKLKMLTSHKMRMTLFLVRREYSIMEVAVLHHLLVFT